MEKQYPYQNKSLSDMEGEIWKEVKDFEGILMISNLGRIKALEREIVHGRYHSIRILPERIIPQRIVSRKKPNKRGDYLQHLHTSININCVKHSFVISRLVYSYFVKPIKDFEEEKIYVCHKDDNTLNNRSENLFLSNSQQLTRRNIQLGKTLALDYHQYTDEQKRKIKRNRRILQFNTDGVLIALFDSILEAGTKTGINISGIGQACRNNHYKAGGYIWQYDLGITELSPVFLAEYNKKTIPKNVRIVSQYDLQGNFIIKYESLSDASLQTSFDSTAIGQACRGRLKTAKGYIWKYKSNGLPLDQETLKKHQAPKTSSLDKSVRQYDSQNRYIATYPTICAAARSMQISRKILSTRLLKYNKANIGGYIWIYNKSIPIDKE